MCAHKKAFCSFVNDMNKVHYSSNKQDWETPTALFNELHEKYHFDLDAAASKKNAKLDNYFTVEDDALSQE